ncbi:MAG: hypothetical protein WA981_15275 [Glaciecola sp.]
MHGITVYLSVAFDIGATVSSKEQFSDFVEDAKDIFGDIDLGHYCPSTYNVSSRKFLADFYESVEKKIHIRDEEFIIKYRLSSSGYLQMILRKELSSGGDIASAKDTVITWLDGFFKNDADYIQFLEATSEKPLASSNCYYDVFQARQKAHQKMGARWWTYKFQNVRVAAISTAFDNTDNSFELAVGQPKYGNLVSYFSETEWEDETQNIFLLSHGHWFILQTSIHELYRIHERAIKEFFNSPKIEALNIYSFQSLTNFRRARIDQKTFICDKHSLIFKFEEHQRIYARFSKAFLISSQNDALNSITEKVSSVLDSLAAKKHGAFELSSIEIDKNLQLLFFINACVSIGSLLFMYFDPSFNEDFLFKLPHIIVSGLMLFLVTIYLGLWLKAKFGLKEIEATYKQNIDNN